MMQEGQERVMSRSSTNYCMYVQRRCVGERCHLLGGTLSGRSGVVALVEWCSGVGGVVSWCWGSGVVALVEWRWWSGVVVLGEWCSGVGGVV